MLGKEQSPSAEEERPGDPLVLGLTDCWGWGGQRSRPAGDQRLGTGREEVLVQIANWIPFDSEVLLGRSQLLSIILGK